MDSTTKSLCKMLRGEDPELTAAAARVLGELGPSDPAVLDALADALAGGVGPARLYALAALARSPSADAVAGLLPALTAPEELRRRAVEAIAGFGSAAVPRLKDAALGDDPALRRAAASILARIGGQAAHALLLRALAEGDLELSKHICFELNHVIGEMPARERGALLAQVEAYLAQKKTQKDPVALASGLILLGFLADPKARKTLLKFARPANRGDVRRRALQALRGIADSLSEADLKTLVGCLEEKDLANVVLPAADLLRPISLPPSVGAKILALAGSTHQPVREFALYKMGRLDTPEAASILVDQLDAPQPAVRELALASLRRNPAAVPLLLKRLKTEGQAERLWTLARVLEPHAASLTSSHCAALSKGVLDCLEKDDRRAEPLAYLLRRAAPEALDAALLKRAQALKAGKRFAEANHVLRMLVRGGAAPPDALYQAAVVALKVSPKGLNRSERAAEPALGFLDRLLGEEGFDLARRLRAERALEPADLFYVGFHFAEQLAERREFGGALLRHLIAKSPRSAIAASAQNKLRLEAFPPDKPPKARKPAAKAAGKKAPAPKAPSSKRS